MAYSLYTDIQDALKTTSLVQLSNDTLGSSTVDTTLVENIIARADAIIDGELHEVYETPLTTVPEVIKGISVDYACYFLLQRVFAEMPVPTDWADRYKDAKQRLSDIADLKIALPDAILIESAEAAIVAPDKAIDFNDETRQESFF
jgi:phage gp36-like protein